MDITLPTPRRRLIRLLAGAYLLLLAYGTLFPMRGWRPPIAPITDILMYLPANPPSDDMIANILVYIPAGILLMFALPGRRLPKTLLAVAICALLSFALEYLQAWLPSRKTSGLDLALNTAGALLGTLSTPLAAIPLRRPFRLPGYAHPLRYENTTRAGLVALALWLGAHWAPFVPSLDPGQLWESIKPVWAAIRDGGFDTRKAIACTLETLAIGMMLNGMLRNPYAAPFWLLAAMLGMLVGKPFIVGRELDTALILGTAIGTLLFAMVPDLFSRRRAIFAATALLAAWAITSLGGTFAATPQQGFNWIPLRGHLANPISGILDLFDIAWPGALLGYLALHSGARRYRALVLGILAIVAYAGVLEWIERWQPGGFPDVTDILVPAATYAITFVIGAHPRPR